MLLAAVIGTGIGCGERGGGSGAGGAAATTNLGNVGPTAGTDTDGFVAGQASITVKPAATETITATYTGDANYGTSWCLMPVTITVQ